MSKTTYPWKRFWCPQGAQIPLLDGGYLVDPESEFGKYYLSDILPFDAIQSFPCLILLGEPGIGKSTALDSEQEKLAANIRQRGDALLRVDLRDCATDQRLANKVFDTAIVREWRSGTSTLHLFLDSLDEALLQTPNIGSVLGADLKDLPVERLRIRIACRSYDWQARLESTLKDLWGTENVGVFELAPLRRVDVISASQAEAIGDVEQFLADVNRLGAVPFAIKPVTLRFLISSFRRNRSLPSSRSQLYRDGCRQLCAETSDSRRDAKAIGNLTPEQRLEIAARTAAVLQLSNRSAIYSGADYGDVQPEDAIVDELVSGFEGAGPTHTEVTLAALREVLGTALFSGRGANRFGWSHQTYAEFLAAYCLNQHKASSDQVFRMLLHPDGSGNVVPQLRETAAWFASINRDVFRVLVKSDPAVIMRSDLTSLSHSDRADLVTEMLAAFESEDLLRDHLFQFANSVLDNPALESILRPFITDGARREAAREAAIDIATACKTTTLQGDLVKVALNSDEPRHVRTLAAVAVGKIGDGNAKAALKPLTRHSAEVDPDDELKGAALLAVWPDEITADDLFTVLTTPRRKNTYGTYANFLHSDFATSLAGGDLPIALRWAKGHLSANPELDPLARIASQVLVRATSFISNEEVRLLLAEVLTTQWELTYGPGPVAAILAKSPGERRQVAMSILPMVATKQFGASMLMDTCSLCSEDVLWLLDEMAANQQPDSKLIAQVIRRLLRAEDVENFGAVRAAARAYPVLEQEVRPLIEEIKLNSDTAKALREEYQQAKAYDLMRSARSEGTVPDPIKIQAALDEADPISFFKVWGLLGGPGADGEFPNEPLNGWSRLDANVRIQIEESAERFLIAYRPPNVDDSWREGRFPAYMAAADRAITVLRVAAPRRLEVLDSAVWSFWAKVVVSYSPIGQWAEFHSEILKLCFEGASEALLDALDAVIDGQNKVWGNVLALQCFKDFWNDRVAALLRSKLSNSDFRPESFRILLSALLAKGDDEARQLAISLIDPPPSEGPERERAQFAAAELMTHSPDAAWTFLWPIFKRDSPFGIGVFYSCVSGFTFGTRAFAANLKDAELADLYVWLTSKGVGAKRDDDEGGFVTPQIALYHWYLTLPSVLANRGSAGACDALRSLVVALPDFPGLKFYLKQAEELYRRTVWVPPSPKEILSVLSNPSARIVRGADDLLQVIIESLQRLQASLQGETPAAIDLWSDLSNVTAKAEKRLYRPKDENALSDYIKRHLTQDLRDRGVIINREVEISRSMGGDPGKRTDIYVAVGVPGSTPGVLEIVRVIIEVKGCWNRELESAMRTQLVARYLNEYGCRHGIYLVGWFECRQWDESDSRRAKAPKLPKDEARRQYDLQAEELSVGGNSVKAFVLDAALQ